MIKHRAARARFEYRQWPTAGPRRQSGVALITVLLVFAIATLLVTEILTHAAIDRQRVTGTINRTQAYYYALASEKLAMLILRDDYQADQKEYSRSVDHLQESWAQGPLSLDIDAIGNVTAQIIDVERYFNINQLVKSGGAVPAPRERERFIALLEALDIHDAELADNLIDYLDSDKTVTGFESEGQAAAERVPAYRLADNYMTDLSELLLVNGFTPDIYNTLAPHLIVSDPASGQLNVNTAGEHALASLMNADSSVGIGQNKAQNIVNARGYTVFDSQAKITGDAAFRGVETSPLKFHSDYYEVNIRANYAGYVAYLTTVIKEVLNPGTGLPDYIVESRRETNNLHRFAGQ